MEPARLDERVELRELLGEGGMGEVHAAWDRALDRPVAVKLLRGADPRGAERLLLEARLQARVEHPHVVRVFEVGALAGRPCILFQLVRGKTLADLAASLGVADRVELVRQAATGLHAAHQEGLVHRDVKPGNILVEESEDGSRTALVTDFGLAHAEEGGLTRSGLLPGTLDFMAPEQLAGGGPVDFRSDVYALGATLYAALAGRPPFRVPSSGQAADSQEQVKVLRRILDEEAPPLASVAPGLPRELSLVCQKAMEKEPASRYPSAEAFAADLTRFQRGEPVRAKAATASERAWKWTRRNPTAARSLAAALAVLILAGGFTIWQARQAGAEALEAARLGAVASSLESRMRMEYLSPPHDLRPALAEVRREVEQLRPLAARRSGGPASVALGKGLELLGDLDGARASYQRAWDLGFRTPPAAEGLGLALCRLYERERELATQALAPEARDGRLAALRAELLEPARQVLEAADRAGWRGGWLDAAVAVAEGRTERARERAREALAADPALYEARLLEGRAFAAEAKDLVNESRHPEAGAALGRAIAVLEDALQAGRSDPRIHLALAEAHYLRAFLAVRRGSDAGAHLEEALGWLDRLGELHPDDPGLISLRGQVRSTWGTFAENTGRGDPVALYQAAIADLTRARQLLPGDIRTTDRLLYALYYLGFLKHQRGEPAKTEVEEGERVYRAVAQTPAARGITHYYGMLLLSERSQERRRTGEASPQDQEAVLRAGAEAQRLLPRRPSFLLDGLLVAGIQLAQARWDAGQDPRPELRRALEHGEELLRESPTVDATLRMAWAQGVAGLLLLTMGADAADLLARARELARRAEEETPGHPMAQLLRGETGLDEARRLLSLGADADAPLEEADRWIGAARQASQGRLHLRDDLPQLALQRGAQDARRGRDPTGALARAEELFLSMLRKDPGDRTAFTGLAQVAVLQAGWARCQGRPGEAAARAGLAGLEAAAPLVGRDPVLLVLLGRLQGLAGDRAAARASLDRAYVLQPLVRGNAEAKAAEAELAGAGR